MTVPISIQLILAQVVRSRSEIEDARMYVERMLTGLYFGSCSACESKSEYRHSLSLPLNDHEDDEEKDPDTNKWTVEYDPDATPTAEEASALDQSDAQTFNNHTIAQAINAVSTSPSSEPSCIPSSEFCPILDKSGKCS